MKRITLFLVALLLCVNSLLAVPAHPNATRVQQPDGSFLTIRLCGDEWMHFTVTADGYSVVKDSRGYYVYAELKGSQLQPTAQVAHDATERQAAEQAFVKGLKKYQAPAMTGQTADTKRKVEKRQQQALAAHREAQYDYNNFKGLIILIQYNDKEFSRADFQDYVNDMVNQENYTGYHNTSGQFVSCTGSVRDYFSDNSGAKFQPEFDVVGPYTIDYSQYYVNATENANEIINSVLDLADPDVDYSQYDGDGDGVVDLVYFIVAGNGANYGGNDGRLWWPHRSIVFNPYATGWGDWMVVKDGVTLLDYASSVELAGYTSWPSSIQLDGIGTICHEFSHVLGLPDFYDTNYEQGGQSNDPGRWSVMAGGSYENDSHTPVGYSLYERYSVGFTDEPPVIEAEGSYTLEPLFSSQTGFRINSQVENEFFLLESRKRSSFKWDAYLPGSGMLVHRVDMTDKSMWDNNEVNANPAHNYYEVVRAGGSSHSGSEWDVFPGTGHVTVLNSQTSPANLRSWNGKSTKWGLENIAKSADGTITFDVTNTFILLGLGLPETATVKLGLPAQLSPILEPYYVDCELTWSSDDETIATVSPEGVITGVSEGSCTITVSAENGMEASCLVTIEAFTPIDIATFKTQETGEAALLQLTNAEVLYVNKNTAYVRDETGTVVFQNIGFKLKKNQIVNGTLIAMVGMENNMVQVEPISGITNADNITIETGDGVQPREVAFEDLTADDYADYVLVKGVTIEAVGGWWAVCDNNRARLWNLFRINGVKLPSEVEGKTFDVEAIYGTDVIEGEVVNELYLLSSVTETEPEVIDGISSIRQAAPADGYYYDLQGRRVSPDTKGVVIHNGKKMVIK